MIEENYKNNWKSCEIDDIADKIHYGYTATAKPDGDGVKYLRISDIQNGHVNWAGVPTCDITEEEFKKFQLFKNDLVFARTGGTVGKSFLLNKQTPENAVFASYLIRVIINDNVFPNYIYYFFQSLNYWSQIELNKTGLKTNVNAKILSRLKFNLPPLPEQRAIVSKIEQLFSELDHGIANLQAAKDKLEIYRQAVLKKAFEGGRETTTIGDKFDFIGGGTPSKSNPDYWNGDISWCSVKDVKGDFLFKTKDSITELGVNKSATNIAEIGQVILITRISPGKSIIPKIRTAINQDLKIVFPKVEYQSKFTHYLFKSLERECIKRSSGTTVLGINLNSLKEIKIPDIPAEEQEAIIEFIESRLSVCDNILDNIEEGLEKSEALRHSILKQAFKGKLLSEEELEACKKEADWEPAEQLLERIKTEKEVKA